MNFSFNQWLSSIVLDALLKVTLVTVVGLAITMGFGTVWGFVCLALALSAFNFVCLFLGCTFAVSFQLFHVRLSSVLQFMLSVGVGNALFVGLFTAFVSMQHGPNDIGFSVTGDAIAGAVLAAINLLSVLIVAVSWNLARRVAQKF